MNEAHRGVGGGGTMFRGSAAPTQVGSPPPGATAPVPPVSTGAPGPAPQNVRTVPPADFSRPQPRRARLTVKHIDPWSVLKLTFFYSIALLVVLVVAMALLWLMLSAMGVFNSIDNTVSDLTNSTTTVSDMLSFSRIVGGTAVLGAVNVVLITALGTLAAFLYNVCSDLVGGIEVTLSDRD